MPVVVFVVVVVMGRPMPLGAHFLSITVAGILMLLSVLLLEQEHCKQLISAC